MKGFLTALQFLTIVPIKIKQLDEKKIPRSMVYFPLVGLMLGLILTGTDKFLYFLGFEQIVINMILIIFLIVLTGGIHLDGLADTMDALLSRKNKEDMLNIMRDSHIGVMGVLSLIGIISLKVAFLSSISITSKSNSLIFMCVLSRWSLVLSMVLFPYAREEGKAKSFIKGVDPKIFIFSTIAAIGCMAIVWKIQSLMLMGAAIISVYIIGKHIKSKISGITGDTLGATNELVEVIVLLGIFLLERFGLWMN
ncbi:MAG: adenosylcobinamide-GDP ribazoletransferase [Candidatus Omnitrophota bacterium]